MTLPHHPSSRRFIALLVLAFGAGGDAESVVKSIIALAREPDMCIYVEGVAALVDEAGVDQVQGYLFGRPCPADEIAFDRSAELDALVRGASRTTGADEIEAARVA